MSKKCPFDNPPHILMENELARVILDGFPVSRGHTLIIPKRCVRTLFDTTLGEKIAMFDLLDRVKKYLDDKYKPQGYNVGVNVERTAGQTVFHCHMHVIPRYEHDAPKPGGIRWSIPGRDGQTVEKKEK